MRRMGLLLEMAVYSEDDVFAMNPVASVSTEVVTNLEGDELRKYVYEQIKSIPIENPQNQITESDIGILIRHHCGQRIRKKSALLALPHIINANYITHPWRRKVDKQGGILKGKDARQSGMISAPILIDGVKYLCNITQKINVDGTIFPYALTLKDADGSIIEGEKMDCTFQVPDSNSEHPTFGDTHISKVTTSPDTNPSSTANIVKGNNTNENKSRRNMKKTITESQLKGIIAESVKQVLKEGRFDQPQYYSNPNPKAKSKEERFREMLLKDIASVNWVRVGTDTPWAKQANAQAKAVARKWNLSIRDLSKINFAQNYSVNDTQSEALINKAVKDYINTGMFIDKERMNSDFDGWFDDVMHSPEGKQIGQRNRPQSMKESKLRKIVAESVRKVLKEAYNPQDDTDAKEFIDWALNSDVALQNMWGYYGASREGNENDANWYMDKLLFAYANEKGCEESELNTTAIEKAINEWGYYNYQDDEF